MRAFTVGHSTHSLDRLVALVARHGAERVVDVRRRPRSGRHPQFDLEALAAGLPERGVDYRHLPGGRRRPTASSSRWLTFFFAKRRGLAYAVLGELDAFAAGALCDCDRRPRVPSMRTRRVRRARWRSWQ